VRAAEVVFPALRVNEARETTTRDAFRLARTFAPQRPFGRPAPACPSVTALPPRCRFSSPFHPRASSRIRAGSALVHAPLCHWESRFFEPLASLADFCNLKRRAGTPDERPTLARERGFCSAARLHQPMQVASASRCVAASGACEPRPARDGFTLVAFHLRGRGKSWAGVLERRLRAFLNDSARALLVALRAPGSPARLAAKPGALRRSSHRPRFTSDAAPRRATPSGESRCLIPRRNPYATGGLLLRARLDHGSITPPPQRHCSGARTPFFAAARSACP